MADMTKGLEARCRNCGNTGISPWTGEPCGCRAGKALAHLAPQKQADETKTWADRPYVHPVEALEYGVYFTGEHGEPDELAAMFTDAKQAHKWASACYLPTAVREMAQYQEPRAIVRHFALAMEAKLAANDAHKGGWRLERPHALLRHLRAEVAELHNAVRAYYRGGELDELLLECADVALLAMMVADRYGAFPVTDERGRAVKTP